MVPALHVLRAAAHAVEEQCGIRNAEFGIRPEFGARFGMPGTEARICGTVGHTPAGHSTLGLSRVASSGGRRSSEAGPITLIDLGRQVRSSPSNRTSVIPPDGAMIRRM